MASTDPAPASPLHRALRRLAIVGLGALTLVTVLGFGGEWWWMLDLLAHFRGFALAAAMLAAIVLAALRWWRLAAWSLALVLLHLALVVPLYAGGPAPTDAPRLRVISFNVLNGNPQTPEAARHVASLDPDVVALLEVSEAQLQAFEAALPGYHRIAEPHDDPFGIAVLTRTAPTKAEVRTLGTPWPPVIELELPLGGQPLAMLAIHPPPPVTTELSHTRDALLGTVAQWATQRSGPTLVVGDLNATPWSAPLRALLDDSPLRSTQRFGLQPTWPAGLGPLGLPIDHALCSDHLVPIARTVGPSFGSDHRMLMVDLELRASESM